MPDFDSELFDQVYASLEGSYDELDETYQAKLNCVMQHELHLMKAANKIKKPAGGQATPSASSSAAASTSSSAAASSSPTELGDDGSGSNEGDWSFIPRKGDKVLAHKVKQTQKKQIFHKGVATVTNAIMIGYAWEDNDWQAVARQGKSGDENTDLVDGLRNALNMAHKKTYCAEENIIAENPHIRFYQSYAFEIKEGEVIQKTACQWGKVDHHLCGCSSMLEILGIKDIANGSTRTSQNSNSSSSSSFASSKGKPTPKASFVKPNVSSAAAKK